jgi:hypothetical protein
MRSALAVAATFAVLGVTTTGAVMAQSGSAYAPLQISSIESELQADAAAIKQDKGQMDRDQQAGNQAAFLQDKHHLYLDTEQLENDRGTAEDGDNAGKSKGW